MAREARLVYANGDRTPIEAGTHGAIELPLIGSDIVSIELDPPEPAFAGPRPLPSKTIEAYPLGETGPRVLLDVRDFSKRKKKDAA